MSHSATILLDMDGTIVDTAPDLVAALNYVLSKNGFDTLEPALAAPMIGHGAGAMIEQGLALLDEQVHDDTLTEMEQAFMDYYVRHCVDQCRPFDGVFESLETLASENYKLAVCTNTEENLARQILQQMDLIKWFSAVCGGDTFPSKKPNPEHLFGTVDMVGGNKSNAIMVGDSRSDIDAAKSANIPVVGVTHGYSNVPIETLRPDCVISHFRDLHPEVLNLLT